MGVRIFKLAKELDMTSKDLIAFLQTQGRPVKSHMSTIDESVANILRDRLRPKSAPSGTGSSEKKAAGGTARSGTQTTGSDASAGTRGRPAAAAAAAGAPAARRGGTSGDSDAGGDRGKGTQRRDGGRERRVRIFVQDGGVDDGYLPGGGRRRPVGRRPRRGGRGGAAVAVERPKSVEITLPATAKDLSAATTIRVNDIVKTLMTHGQMVPANAFLDEDQITLICLEYEIDVTFKKKEQESAEFLEELSQQTVDEAELELRAPVVTFMGHVDHGKTSLLDYIRKTTVTDSEAGGITQHLGAYRVDHGDSHVVFIDTPGHQAFTEMRARGANVTDIAVLVVAADDGVKPQTVEAYNHAKAAEVPVVVALNKIDRPNANAMRAKQQLSELGLQPVEWGGDTEVVDVSAITGQGIDSLVETLSLTAEILELKANSQRSALGTVIEAAATTSRGVVATILVQDGTLKRGDYVVCGAAHGRVRSMVVNGDETTETAGPSTPVQITGLNAAPAAGERLYAVEDANKARDIAEEREREAREEERARRQQKPVTLETLFDEIQQKTEETVQTLGLILKADVQGSSEALRSSLENLSTDEVKVQILHSGVGGVTQDDVSLADASGAIVIGFHVGADERARALAEDRGVEIRIYQIIYEAIADVKAAMESRLRPEFEEEIRGHAEIRQVYRASKIGNIAGCFVTDGTIQRSDKVRLLREGRIVYTGDLGSLKRFKDDVKEVREGFECGIKIAKFDDIKEGDSIEAFHLIEKRRTI